MVLTLGVINNMETILNSKHKLPSKTTFNRWCWAWFFIAPTIAGLIILNIIPIFQTFYLSFFRTGDFGLGNIFIGFDNYKKLFADMQVWHALINTLLYTIIVVPLTIIFAMIAAVFLNSKIRGLTIYRSIYFIPVIAAPAAVAMVWNWMYNYNFGLINHVLQQLGIPAVNWIDNPKIALISIAIIGIWSGLGYNMVLLLAGLQEVPNDYYEASSIDGASHIKQFFSITLPLVSPSLFFVLVTSIISSLQVFDTIYMMVGVASPSYDNVVSLVYLFYNNSFKYSLEGYGSAIVMLLLALILIITFIQVKLQKKWVNYM